MSEKLLHFTDIAVYRALGIQHGDEFEFSDISSGVNLIYGPNGSGKSTTALVIQELLWPGRTGLERPSANGKFTIDKNRWSVRIDAGHTDISGSQGTGTVPNTGPAENRSRYMLALHELISDRNADFARIITAESQGGFDLDAAKNNLKFSGRIRKDSKAIERGYKARQYVKEARSAQMQIENEKQRLPGLEDERLHALEASRKASALAQALKLKNLESESRELNNRIKLFHPSIALLQGDEHDKLNKLTEKEKSTEGKLIRANADAEKAAVVIKETNLSDDMIRDDAIPLLKGLRSDLADVEKEIDNQKRLISTAEIEEKTARLRIGDHLADQQLSALNTVEIADLSSLAKRFDTVSAEEAVLEERERTLIRDCDEKVLNLRIEDIRDGISLLKHWLKSEESNGTPSSKLLNAASAFIALLAVVLAFTYNPIWALLLLPAAALLLFNRAGKNSDFRDSYVADYENTRLQPPEAWETQSVLQRLNSLVDLAELRIKEDNNALFRSNLTKEKDALKHTKLELEEQKSRVEEKLGLRIELENNWLPLLVQNIGRWQISNSTLTQSVHEQQRLTRKHQELQVKIMEHLHAFGYHAITSAAQASTVIEDIEKRLSDYRTAKKEKVTAEQRIQETHDELKQILDNRKAVFSRLDLDPSQEAVISDWLKQRPKYLDLKMELDKNEFIREDCLKDLIAKNSRELLDLDEVTIEERIKSITEESSRADELLTEINKIENQIDKALTGHDLSDALSGQDSALALLEGLRERDCISIAGDLLVDWVQKEAIDRARPQVFKRACELVSEFTLGRLSLQINDRSNPPEFRASVSGRPSQPVDRLSVGERVQVLIAIRTAFLEQNEPVRLPLLLDEALGTSDELRADLIIDSVIKIAERGRQIFYFTAQQDEISKWKNKLEESTIKHRVFDLGEIRHLKAAAASPLNLNNRHIISPPPPSPEGLTHLEYGRLLGVPNINPMDENIDAVNLWHLTGDDEILFGLLKLRIESWGQLKNLVQHGGKALTGSDPVQIDRIFASAKALEAACRAWRAGRGSKVDRRILQDSGCVSERFIGDVTDLAEINDGDASAIIKALEDGIVSNWRKTGTEKLKEFFEENGFLSTEPLLSMEDIRIRTLASVSASLNRGLLDSALIDRILDSLPE